MFRNYIGVYQRPGPKKRPISVEPNFTGSDEVLPPEDASESALEPVTPVEPEPEIDAEIGAVFGELTVVNEGDRDKNYNRYAICVCSCSEGLKNRPLIRVREDNLRSGRIVSCGCQKKKRMWERNKAVPSNVGGFENGSTPQPLTDQQVEGSKNGAPKAPPKVEGCLPPGAIEDRCPHGHPCSPYIPGRVHGINVNCYGCHNIWGYEELFAEWEKVLGIEHKKNLVRRLDVFEQKNPIRVGGSGDMDVTVEKEASEWMQLEPNEEETGPIIRRKPAKRVSPSGASPDVDFVEDE